MIATTVYYDGSCPLCAREIAFYQGCRGANSLLWVDVSALPDKAITAGLSRSEALARFHVRTPDGQIFSGGQGFAHLWYALPRMRPLGRLFLNRPLSYLLDFSYNLFLRFRPLMQQLARRQQCGRNGQNDRL